VDGSLDCWGQEPGSAGEFFTVSVGVNHTCGAMEEGNKPDLLTTRRTGQYAVIGHRSASMFETSTTGAHPSLAAALEYPILAVALVQQYVSYYLIVLLAQAFRLFLHLFPRERHLKHGEQSRLPYVIPVDFIPSNE
jgi:hypothetical protein